MRWLAPIITAGCLVAAGSGAGTVAAQTMEPGSWMRDWSPLAPVADLPRTMPVAPALPALLTAPAPRVGLHWSAGNPAGLAFEGADEWGDFTMGYASEAGDFRRPLDPGEVHSGMLAGSGWRPLGPGAVSGGVALQRTGLGGDAFANARTPYRSSPHTSADTSGADMVELVTRVEGAGGWRVGGWGLGLAIGYETFDGRTDVSPTPRFRRGGAPAATVGVVRALSAGVVVGAHARIQGDVETLSVSSPRTDVARVYPLEGYTNPVGVDYSTGGYNRRIEGDAYAFGLSASFRALDARWVAWGEVSERRERQSSQFLSDPPSDDWRTSGTTAGLAAARPIAGDRWLVVANVTWTRVTGEATRVALEEEGVLFEATEAALVGWGDVRWTVAPEWRRRAARPGGASGPPSVGPGGRDGHRPERVETRFRCGGRVDHWSPCPGARYRGRLAHPRRRDSRSHGLQRRVPALRGPGARPRIDAHPQPLHRTDPPLGDAGDRPGCGSGPGSRPWPPGMHRTPCRSSPTDAGAAGASPSAPPAPTRSLRNFTKPPV
jgi:hypothetical protein